MSGTHLEPPPHRESARRKWRILATAALASLVLIGGIVAAQGLRDGRETHALNTARTRPAQRPAADTGPSTGPSPAHSSGPSQDPRTGSANRSSRLRHRNSAGVKPAGVKPAGAPIAPVVAKVLRGPAIKPMTAEQLASRRAVIEARIAARQAAVQARIAAVKQRKADERAARIAASSFDITVGTFNVLASQHSTPTGDHPNYPSASVRSVGAANLIKAHHVDVVGTQELKPDQLNAITRMTGFVAWPGYRFGSRNTDNNILYNPARFTFVSGTSYPITFMHAVRPQTVLKLRENSTGREMYFVNTHVSAGHEPKYTASRRRGHYSAVAEINKLKAEGLPVFLTGDMNDRAVFFCRVVPPTGLLASDGGTVAGGCHPPGRLAVDWVLGTGGVSWSGYWQDRSPIGRISDHFFVSARAHVSGASQ
ncbi:MAG: endonuclease/exonuclease/phosphatase family protein [Nocardioides sp.]